MLAFFGGVSQLYILLLIYFVGLFLFEKVIYFCVGTHYDYLFLFELFRLLLRQFSFAMKLIIKHPLL